MTSNNYNRALIIFVTIISTLYQGSVAIMCNTCCGCDGQRSVACSTYGMTEYGTAINTDDIGRQVVCPSLADICMTVSYYDSLNQQMFFMKKCMSREQCIALKSAEGQFLPFYTLGPGIYGQLKYVNCCQFDGCNNEGVSESSRLVPTKLSQTFLLMSSLSIIYFTRFI